jgi:recombination protein RecT
MSTGQIALITPQILHDNSAKFMDKIRASLPKQYKDQAERFFQISIIAFTTNPQREKLAKCRIDTFFRSVIKAARYGFALDGENAYAIPYKDEVTCQFDYKAVVTCARRAGSIKDARFQVVCKNDTFDWYEENGEIRYKFRMADDEDNRGPMRGAYAVAILPGGTTRFEYMSKKDLDKIRSSSKSPDSPAWVNWPDRMYGKAVLKRALQGVDLDPATKGLIRADNEEFDLDRIIDGNVATARTEVMEDLATRLESKLKKEPVAVIEYEEPVDEVEEDPIPDFGLTEDELQEPVEVTPVHRPVAARPVPPRAMPARASSGPSIANHRGTK